MDDPVKIYDSVHGTQWLEGRGYGTLTTGRNKNKSSWTNMFTTWKRKGKTSAEGKKITCQEAFSLHHPQHHSQLYSQQQQAFLSSSSSAHPHRQEEGYHNHQEEPTNTAKFCSLSAASGSHYLSTNGNRNQGSNNFYSQNRNNTPCNRLMMMSPSSRRLPPSLVHVPSSSSTVRLPSKSPEKRSSLFATEWESSHAQSPLSSSRKSVGDFGPVQCTCHSSCQSSCLKQQDFSFNARYADTQASLRHFCQDQSCNHPDDQLPCNVISSSLPRLNTRHKQVSSSTLSPAKMMMQRMKHRRSETNGVSSNGVTDVHGTQDHHHLQTSQSRTCHDDDQGLDQRTRNVNGFPCVSHHQDMSDRSMNNGFVDKKPTKFSSSTISAGFVRALKRSSREPASSSTRKSIFNPELSAYDLIKQQLQQEELDEDFLLEEDDVVNGELFSMELPPKGGYKSNSLRCPSSSSKAEYLSKNLRIAGQGVTLFPWEEPFHNNVKSSPVSSASPSSTSGTRSRSSSSSLKKDSFSSNSPSKSQNGLQECNSESMPNYIVPEPDYDLSDDSCEGEATSEGVAAKLSNSDEILNCMQSIDRNESVVNDKVIPTSIESCSHSSPKSVGVKENVKHSSRTSCLKNESPHCVTSSPTTTTTTTPVSSSSSSQSNQSLQLNQTTQQSQQQQQNEPPKTSFTRSILKKTSFPKQGGLKINEEFDRQQLNKEPTTQVINGNTANNCSGNNNNTPDLSHSSGSTFASPSSLVNAPKSRTGNSTVNNKSSSSPSCMNNGKNLIKKSSTPTTTTTSCKTPTTASHNGNNNNCTSNSNARKTPLNMMMKLMLNNKRTHRKHVTFRSYKEDGSLILDQITEAIPEEDESLYDDIQEPFECQFKNSQVNRDMDSMTNGIAQESPEDSQEEDVFVQDDDDDDGMVFSEDFSRQSTVNLMPDSGSSGPLDSLDESRSFGAINASHNKHDDAVTGISSSSDSITSPNSDHNSRLSRKNQEDFKSESKRGNSASHAENNRRQQHHTVVSKIHEPEDTEDDDHFANERLHEDCQDCEEECDNENEYYDHLLGGSSVKNPFAIAFYNSLSDEPVTDCKSTDCKSTDCKSTDCHLQTKITHMESGTQTTQYHHYYDSKDDVYEEFIIEGENNGRVNSCSTSSLGSSYRHHHLDHHHDREASPSASPEALSSSNFKPVFKAHSTSKSNKIVIDVPSANSYEAVGQQQSEEHIYEELLPIQEYHAVRSSGSSPNNDEEGEHRSMFDGASKDEILEYLEDAKERVSILITADKSTFGISDFEIDRSTDNLDRHMSCPSLDHDCSSTGLLTSTLASSSSTFASSTSSSVNSSASSSSSRRNRSSNVSNSSADSAVTTGSSVGIDEEPTISERISPPITRSVSLTQLVERNDSGVGTETSKPNLLRRCVSGETDQRCTDCEQLIDPAEDEVSGIMFFPLTCALCDKKRSERKEIVSEFVDTEFKYGRDLRIIKEEFYRPMEVTGLMTKDQLKSVFINLDELIMVNSRFAQKLDDALQKALEEGDKDYSTINLGTLFVESSATMLQAFETYCSRQGTASLILTQLEKEKELLRIFLRVSQMENTLLRRMNLSAFLMVPVQRVTKYPLLLNRLSKVTPLHHRDRDVLRAAQQMVELHLEHINQQTKATPNKIWRRFSKRFFLR